MTLTRRRFLAISAAAATWSTAASAGPVPQHWLGQALGARASIRLRHPDASAITARCLAEIDRLEDILSLYRPDSALSRLNRTGQLDAPPFELLECLSLAGSVHRASNGVFDVTLQPLWSLWAEAAVQGRRPSNSERRAALAQTGWGGLSLSSRQIALQPGMALTLNGIGQGYVADRVAALLTAEGLTDILIDTGEMRALGNSPDGDTWTVQIARGGSVPLTARALATSAPRGTCFDGAGQDGHILDPRSGAPAMSPWSSVSISAPTAALADALATAACVMRDEHELETLLAAFPDAKVEGLHSV